MVYIFVRGLTEELSKSAYTDMFTIITILFVLIVLIVVLIIAVITRVVVSRKLGKRSNKKIT